MGFLKGLVTLLATKYGVVTNGKYKGTSLGVGSDTDKKVTTNAEFDQLLFIKGAKEVARVSVKEVASYEVISDTRANATIKLTWTSGENSVITIPKFGNDGKLLTVTYSGMTVGRFEHLLSILATK